jgi:LytR cell envelope-related transcriptional attenuator
VTDFLADLEAELVEAARRCGAHRRLPRPRARAVVRIAVAAAVLAALAGLVALVAGTHTPGREQSAAPATTGGGPATVKPAVGLLAPCGTTGALSGVELPSQLRAAFAVLRRPQTEADPLPEVPDPSRWLPVGAYDGRAVRRLGVASGRGVTRPVYLVPTSDLRTRPVGCGASASRGPGVCLVAGATSQPITVGCFTAADALAGRAAVAADRTGTGARLSVLVPDGVRTVTLAGSREVAATGNLAQRYLPLPGDTVTVALHRGASGCAATADPRLRAAIPALRRAAGAAPPRSLVDATEGGKIAAADARVAGSDGGVTFWIVPASFASDRPCAPLPHACVIPVTDHPVGAPACALVSDARYGGGVIAGPYNGEVAVYGVVAARVGAARVTIDRQTRAVPAHDGVVGGVVVLPWHNGSGVGFSYAPGPHAPVVAVLNGSGTPGLATRTARRLRREAFRTGVIGTVAPHARTRVLFAPSHEADAQAVARVLRVAGVGPLDPAARAALEGSGPLPAAVVVLGRRMR